MSYTDSTTGQVIDGKAYVLKSTEGEELVDPARLFGGGDSAEVTSLDARVAALEEALGVASAPAPVEPVAEQVDPEA